MNETLKVLETRRSCRNFKPEINWDRLPLQFYYVLNYVLKVHGTLLWTLLRVCYRSSHFFKSDRHLSLVIAIVPIVEVIIITPAILYSIMREGMHQTLR